VAAVPRVFHQAAFRVRVIRQQHVPELVRDHDAEQIVQSV
jgi:hypothetical protein